MGVSLFGRLSRSSGDPSLDQIGPPNPNPKNYRIIRSHLRGGNLALEVHYPDCTNYEGRKILVYCDLPVNGGIDHILARNGGALDPHFAGNPAFCSPFARFEPTDRGWQAACKLCDQP